VDQPFRAEIICVRIAGSLAGEDTDAATGAGSLARGLDDLLVNSECRRRNRFKIKVSVIATGGKSLAQTALKQSFCYAEFLEEVALVAARLMKVRAGNRLGVGCTHRTFKCTPEAGNH